MNILQLNTRDDTGGAAKVAFRLHQELIRLGINDKMLVRVKLSRDPFVFESRQFPISFFKRNIEKLMRSRQQSPFLPYPNRKGFASSINNSYLENALSVLDFDILHLHWISEFVNFKDLRRVKKPIVWTLHDCNPFTGICHHLVCDKYKKECRHCPLLQSEETDDLSTVNFLIKKKYYENLNLHIVTPSNFFAERVKESALLRNKPLMVIPNGLDTSVFSPTDKSLAKQVLKISPNKKVILFGAVSALSDENKGFTYLQQALQLLKKDYKKDDIELLIFGADTCESIGLDDFSVRCLGHLSDELLMSIVYSAADLVVVPSKCENLPNVVMESFACETPVVAFRIGGIPDLIEHYSNGYMATPFESEDLSAGIKWCLENNANNRLGKNGRNTVTEKFDIEATAKQYIKLYNNLIGK